MSIKHGCEPKNILRLLQLAHDLGLNVVGVSFHVGCEIHDFDLYRKAIAACRRVFEEAAQVGFQMSLVDVGGGFLGAKGTTIKPVISSRIHDGNEIVSFLFVIRWRML